MKTLEEAVLVELAVSENDQRAYAELVNRHQSNLRYSMRQLTNWNEALADDLTQDTFIQAFKELHRFRKEAKFSSWLYRIGYNVFLQYVRKKQLDTQSIDDDPYIANQVADPRQGDETSALHQKVAKLLSMLEPERRSVLHLFLHRQNTQQEISDIMGIPLGTVKTHINRGRSALQQSLQGWQEKTL
ncbi:RNA polymerase sigma factor [Arenicella chitinivorans]|uniref:RNA polymerase sigma factor n=1 Tax=Arenicella chitinivorans TaxID=1329800 RepID=A0A918RX23_9GAMM|nr:sigma-70 family RNA polymerase sigma factor [Arenicella chitinivorans]GHA15836.1 RNA polymerase sigma factor [Arenicella chitinivorans]